MTPDKKICWCGADSLEQWHADYARCPRCRSLVDISPKKAEEHYDSSYWFETKLTAYQQIGCPDLDAVLLYHFRERAAYWLHYFLRHVLPPARVLEVGCGMGTFTYWLNHLGFKTKASELDPIWRDYIRSKLDIDISDYFMGTEPERANRFDAVVFMDVLEHIENPHSFFQALGNELENSGIVMAQLPVYDGISSYSTLQKINDPFLRYLLPGEHVFLYSWHGIEHLLDTHGFTYVQRYNSLFENDMFFVASRKPLARHCEEDIDTCLIRSDTLIAYAALKNYEQFVKTKTTWLHSLKRKLKRNFFGILKFFLHHIKSA